ncbi:MAG: ABC transporter ATP-binding protein [Bacteroidetes bacterium]|nr:ABC transporter ATP-binding protein [Bacteroidota bacterium]
MEKILELHALSKNYGRIKAVDQLSLEVEKGTVFGILGPNGSGKTTTLGMLLGVTRPSAGSFSWFGGEQAEKAKKRIGSLLETPNFYPYMTARQNLKLVAKIKECKNPNIEEVLEQVKLLDRGDDKFKTYSLGMKQRLAIASALLGDPDILLLDEPTNGLDPRGIAEVRQLILEIADRGTTVIMASHILAEVEKVCNHVAVLKKGVLKYSGLASELSGHLGKLVVAAADLEQLQNTLQEHPSIKQIERDGKVLVVLLQEKIDPASINRWLAEKNIHLNHLEQRQGSLEEGFLKLIDS